MAKTKDLFDESTMSFGEHLEALRTHLWKAIIGLVLGMIVSLFIGDVLVRVVRAPLEQALRDYGVTGVQEDAGLDFDMLEYFKGIWQEFRTGDPIDPPPEPEPEPIEKLDPTQLVVKLDVAAAEKMIAAAKEKGTDEEGQVELVIQAEEFAQLRRAVKQIDTPKTFNVQEAFMTYLKVSLVFGLVLSSPWVFWQIWQFVAAGLYQHERKYVYIYLPMSLGLFIGGALFCFYVVFPFVLKFLLGFNDLLDVQPQIRLSEWISFAILLPMMFGVSFQLPLIMLFLERISVFEVSTYREQRRMAVLVIAIISMLLTPADPTSMVLMMMPLVVLYEVGILLCGDGSASGELSEAT